MPYTVKKSDSCPADKPWALIKDSDGEVMGCHMTEDDAMAQMQALMADEPMMGMASKTPGIERRTFHVTGFRIQGGQGQPITLRGHAAVFNQLSDELGFFEIFRERVLPGAFKETIKTGDIRSLFNHDPNFVLGRTKSGTLKLEEDQVGLAIENVLPDTQFARDFAKSIERGDIDQMSFGFSTKNDNWRIENGAVVRELIDVDLFDVSPVTFPAYPQTDVGVRSRAEEMRKKLGAPTAEQEEKVKAEFQARMKAREQFIAKRTPPPDPFSLSEIFKKARITNQGGL